MTKSWNGQDEGEEVHGGQEEAKRRLMWMRKRVVGDPSEDLGRD